LSRILYPASEYKNPNEIDNSEWYENAVEKLKKQENSSIEALQEVLLNFSHPKENMDTGDAILSQLELLEATVRAGFPLKQSNFFVTVAAGARSEKLIHLMQGHTFAVNLAAASLLAAQMESSSFEAFEPLFNSNKDDGQKREVIYFDQCKCFF
jgi:hypothetical protein